MKSLGFVLPVAVFLVVAGALLYGLAYLNPKEIPSALIDAPVPEFDLPPVHGRELGLASKDLRREVALVNVFASWCVACRAEHPLLMALRRTGDMAIHGLNYKDKPEHAAAWLDRFGDPYTRTGADIDGRVGIDFGVYGVPETFIIDTDGRIACKHIGPITEQDLEQKILPAVAALRSNAEAKC